MPASLVRRPPRKSPNTSRRSTLEKPSELLTHSVTIKPLAFVVRLSVRTNVLQSERLFLQPAKKMAMKYPGYSLFGCLTPTRPWFIIHPPLSCVFPQRDPRTLDAYLLLSLRSCQSTTGILGSFALHRNHLRKLLCPIDNYLGTSDRICQHE